MCDCWDTKPNRAGLHCHGLPLALALAVLGPEPDQPWKPILSLSSLSLLSAAAHVPHLSLRVYVYTHNNFGIWWRGGLKPEGNQDR